MPVITIELGIGQADEAQKNGLIERLTADSAQITGIAAEKFVVLINEYPSESIGVGGRSLKRIKAGS